MTSLSHLSKIDRAGARRIVRAWESDYSVLCEGDVRYQDDRLDTLNHARFFREVVMPSTPEMRKLNNQSAVRYVRRQEAVYCQPTTPVSL